MSAAIEVREDFEADELRCMARTVKDANQSRRLLAIAAVYDGMDREEAARIGGMDRDWVHRFNEQGPAGLINTKPPGGGQDFRRIRWRSCAGLWKRGRIRTRTVCHAGAAWTSSAFSGSASAVIYRKCGLVAFSRILVFRTLARGLGILARMRRRLRHLKKLFRHRRRGREAACAGNADRGVVPGRDARGPEERPRLSVGEEGHAAAPAEGPALRERLSVRCCLPE